VNGCLKGLFKLAGLALLALALLAAWLYREPIMRTASRWLGPHSTALPPVADTAVGGADAGGGGVRQDETGPRWRSPGAGLRWC